MGNNPAWMSAKARPDLFLHEEWAVAIDGDEVSSVMKNESRYRCVKMIRVAEKNAPVHLDLSPSMKVPFTKAHGAKNDFLLSWAAETGGLDLECDGHCNLRPLYGCWRRWMADCRH